MYTLLRGFDSTVERVAGAHFTREALALKKNEQFMEFCERAGEKETADLYRKHIQPDEGWHVDIGHRFLARYAVSGDDQEKAKFLGGSGTREPVTSVGVGTRINVFGYAVVEIDYVRALDRPRKQGWSWVFNFTPGF